MISYISGLSIYVTMFICLVNMVIAILFHGIEMINLAEQISYFSIIMILLIIRNIYTGFFEDKRKSTKNNLRALTMHLPVSKKDFILAQYINSIQLFLPAFIFLMILIVFNRMTQSTLQCQFQLGSVILIFALTYILISLEKGIFTYYYIDPRLREISYWILAIIWGWIDYILEMRSGNFIDEIVNNGIGKQWFIVICSFGELKGIFLMIVTFIGGYFCHVKLSEELERSK